jgi:hypothetical protein
MANSNRTFSREAFLLLAQKQNPFKGPQKPTDGDKKKKKKKKKKVTY